MEAKFKNNKYSMLHVKGVLTFDTESVPVQQFQARCADHILQSARHPLSKVSTVCLVPLFYFIPILLLCVHCVMCPEDRHRDSIPKICNC